MSCLEFLPHDRRRAAGAHQAGALRLALYLAWALLSSGGLPVPLGATERPPQAAAGMPLADHPSIQPLLEEAEGGTAEPLAADGAARLAARRPFDAAPVAFDPYATPASRPLPPLNLPTIGPEPMIAPGPTIAPGPMMGAGPMIEPPWEVVIGEWEFLPREALYPFYLGDTKASRMAGQWIPWGTENMLIDGTLGGRFGLFRYTDSLRDGWVRGIQADVEGSAQVRLDLDEDWDVRSTDFRVGMPISISFGRFQMRTGFYHLSSHVGDEFLIKNPGFNRLNYSRDVLFLGASYWLTPGTRVYGEAGWALYSDVSKEWEFLFGIEHAPRYATGLRGAPFYALHGHLREEIDFGGGLTVQAGWAWRSAHHSGLLRTGLHFYNGQSNQFSFFDDFERLVGLGVWYDF